jgi:N-acetylneuraminate synthase
MERTDAQWVLDFELQGKERDEALEKAASVFAQWGLQMPRGDVLTPHFGLHDFYRIGEIEYWIVNDRVNQYCGKFLFLFENQRCPLHHHKIKDETFFIVKGNVIIQAGGEEWVMHPGDTYKMKPGVDHTFAGVGGPALVLEVSLPSIENDNVFADPHIGVNGII